MSQKAVNAFFQARKRPTNAPGKSLKDPLRTLDQKSQNVSFHKLGNLSPSKSRSPSASPFKVPFDKRGLLSPKKVQSEEVSADVQVQVDPVVSSPKKTGEPIESAPSEEVSAAIIEIEDDEAVADKNRTPTKRKPETPTKPRTPESIKKHLGSTNSLATLQARLKNFSSSAESTPSPRARKALFTDDELPGSGARGRSAVKKGLAFDIEVPKLKAAPSSPIKASPRKKILEETDSPLTPRKQLLQPSKILPIPESYESLARLFARLDELVAMLYNRSEAISASKIKAALQKATSKTITDNHLKQIRCVFPSAYTYTWEPKLNSLGKKTGDFELYLVPNLVKSEVGESTPGKTPLKLRIDAMSDRKKTFKYHLLSIVQDHHDEFLKGQGISGLERSEIRQWHKDFDVEKNCPPIDTMDFPPKPIVEAPERNPMALLAKVQGINKNMEAALNQHIAISTPRKAPMTPTTKKIMDDFKLNPALRDLSPALRDRILAKEREKRIREMTTNEAEQKQIEMLQELMHNRVSKNIQSFKKKFRY